MLFCLAIATILALYYSYSADAALLLKHADKARKLAEWLLYRRRRSLSFPDDDPRHGIPFGDDEADTYAHVGGFSGSGHAGPGSDQPEPRWSSMLPRNHDLSSAAEMSRAFCDKFANISRQFPRLTDSTDRQYSADRQIVSYI